MGSFGVVHEYLPHRFGCDSEEMGPIVEIGILLTGKAHIRFIHQGRGLQHVAWSLPSHVMVRQATQFAIDQSCQSLQCLTIATAPGGEQLREFPRWRRVAHGVDRSGADSSLIRIFESWRKSTVQERPLIGFAAGCRFFQRCARVHRLPVYLS
jgi:hypothetical protein